MRRFLVSKVDDWRVELSPYSPTDISLVLKLHSNDQDDYSERTEAEHQLEDHWGKAFKEWMKKAKWSGCYDIAYNDFKRQNSLHDLDSFNEECLRKCFIEEVDEEPQIDWERVYE